jgi:hypothetical protein
VEFRTWKYRKLSLIVAACLILVLSLVGCSGSAGGESTGAEGSPALPSATTEAPAQASETEEILQTPLEEPPLQETEPDSGPPPATDLPATEVAAPPPVRAELAATDPSTVQLASGKVQLVEFFAFW